MLGTDHRFGTISFSAFVGTCEFFVLWLVAEVSTHISSAIVEERDICSGLRLAGFLVAISLVIARAIAGTWYSEAATVRDLLHDGWLAIAFLPAFVFIERRLSSGQRKSSSCKHCGVIPAASYIGVALLYLLWLGKWK